MTLSDKESVDRPRRWKGTRPAHNNNARVDPALEDNKKADNPSWFIP